MEVLEYTPHFADPENARAAGLRSAELAKQRQQELENLRLILATKPIEAIEQPKPPNVADIEVQQQLELTEEQITRTRAMLNDDKLCYCDTCKRGGIDGKERAALLRELRGLCELRLDLRGISRPGQTKPSSRQPRGQSWPEPTPAQPSTTTGSVPPNSSGPPNTNPNQ